MGFAVVTPALITGGFAERMKFSALLVFVVLWGILVYCPICHWVWGGGWLENLGVLDFAGGTVVHINAGVAGLITAIVLGRRKKAKTEKIEPHNIALVAIGTGILWIGWVGFNAGGAPDTGRAVLAVLVTHIAAASAALTWVFVEWVRYRKASVLALFFGAVTGLVAITPAAGYVGPVGAIIIGVVSGIACPIVSALKHKLGYDDGLDAFGVHGFGGIVGSLLTGVFAASYLGGIGLAPGVSMIKQVGLQSLGILTTILWSGVMTYLILKFIQMIGLRLRVTREEEELGLDITYHGERGYRF